MNRFLLSALFLLLLIPGSASAQAGTATIDVFLDCQTGGCDSSHIRNEIPWVNWVRDRTAADVHLLITSQGAGGGGSVYQLSFIGLRSFAGDSTSLEVQTLQQQSDAERRDRLTNRIAQGLLRYVAATDVANRLTVGLVGGLTAAPANTSAADDPWNYWVFATRLQASMDGESREDSQEYELSLNASRTTEGGKIELEVEGSYEEESFQLRSGKRTFITKNWQIDALAVRALAAHWSAGFAIETGRSTFENYRYYARPAAVLEYSFFPYQEFSRRQVTLRYLLGGRHADYMERTIYDRISEQNFDQSLELSARFQQPWGSAQASISGGHYLHDIERYRASAQASMNIRLFRGFSLDVSGSYSRVHDQLYIPAGDADDEEILLRRQALETNYRYRTSVGLRYTFGSIYNNVVNPRVGNVNSF